MSSPSGSNDVPASLLPLLTIISSVLRSVTELFNRIPGSPILVRYIQSSYQDDPYRSLLEVLLAAFAIRTLLQRRTRGEGAGKNFVKLTVREIDDLVDEWTPAPLVPEPGPIDEHTLNTVPVIHGPNGVHVKLSTNGKSVLNMAIPDWVGLVESDKMKEVALNTLRNYGVGSCSPMGFYGTIDVHRQLETDLAAFLGTEAAIIYSQSFSTISSSIPSFAKRGDIIVADRGVNFAIHKGLQISRSTIRWYAHGDMKDLERVLQSVDREQKRKGGKLTRRFIVAEGIFENDGMMLDLPKVMELKRKYKYRLILDESQSFGMIGKHGRGLTEHYNIPAADVDMLLGSMAYGLAAAGGFCAGDINVCDHQRINSSASVFSASLPAMHSTVSSYAVSVLESTPSLFDTLQANIEAFRQQLLPICPDLASATPVPSNGRATPPTAKDALISVPSHPNSALIHVFLLTPPDSIEAEELLLQQVVDEVLSKGEVLITRARRLRGQEELEPEPSLKICLSAAMSKKEVEKAGQSLKAALIKVTSSRKV